MSGSNAMCVTTVLLETGILEAGDILLATDSLPVLLVAEASFSEHRELRDKMRAVLREYLDVLERLVGTLPRRGSLEPAELAVLLMGLPAALAIRHRLLPDAVLEERLSGPVVREHVARLLSV